MRRILSCAFMLIMLLSLSGSAMAESLRTMTAPQLADIIQTNKGKIIFINFFATWCPPCRAELPDLIQVRKEYSEDQLLMIGISLDEDLDRLKQFTGTMEFNYPVYLSDFRLPEMYALFSIPHNVIYLPSGELAYSEPGMLAKKELTSMFNSILKDKQ